MKYRINTSLRTAIAFSDLTLLLVCLFGANALTSPSARLAPFGDMASDWWLYLTVTAVWVSVTVALGMYRVVQNRMAFQEIGHLIKAAFVSAALLSGLLFMFEHQESRARMWVFFVLALVVLVVFRLSLRFLGRILLHRAWGTTLISPARVVVVGEGSIIYETLSMLSNCDQHEVAVLGYIDYQEDLMKAVNLSSSDESNVDVFVTGPLSGPLTEKMLNLRSDAPQQARGGLMDDGRWMMDDRRRDNSVNVESVGLADGRTPLTVVAPLHTYASAKAAARWGLSPEHYVLANERVTATEQGAAARASSAPTAEETKQIEETAVTTLSVAIENLVASTHADNVVVAVSRRYHRLLSKIVTELQRLPVHILLMPDLTDLSVVNVGVTELGEMSALKLRAPILTDMQLALKRILDLSIVLVLLPFLLPLLGVVALAIRLDSSGPIVFKQRRVGQYGKHFTIYKFRTMVQDAEARLREVTTYTSDGKPIFKSNVRDPRVTRVGRLLRRLSLDELPQLFNVLTGHMSLVGPRPELPKYLGFYETWQHFRLWVPPGITGWWQVKGRDKQPMYMYWDDDLYYIRNYSLLLDLQILWLTLTHALVGSTGR